MASSNISSGNKTTRFQKKVKHEYVRGGIFGPYIGNDVNSIIQVNKNLKKVSLPLVGKVGGAGVTGSGTLSGNEQAMSNFDFLMQPTYHRQGVLIDNEENELAEFDLFSEARPGLMSWAMELKRDQMIQAFGAVIAGSDYRNYGGSKGAFGSSAAIDTEMDTWNTNNQDRMLYGKAKSNNTSGNHTTSLDTVDTTNDKLTTGNITLLRRMAGLASPLIRPVMLNGDNPHYVYFVGSLAFRDLEVDSTMVQAQREAMNRGKSNPLFAAGDLLWKNVIIKEVPEIDVFIDGDSSGSPWDGVWGANATGDNLVTSVNGNSRVGVGFFCGAQALGFGIARPASFKRKKEDDYEHQNGVGITMKHDIKKTFYNLKQHGMVTHFHSAAADS